MEARTQVAARGGATLWAARVAGLGAGLVAVLGAILLGWLAWPALLAGGVGGGALLAVLALTPRLEAPRIATAPVAIAARRAADDATRQAA